MLRHLAALISCYLDVLSQIVNLWSNWWHSKLNNYSCWIGCEWCTLCTICISVTEPCQGSTAGSALPRLIAYSCLVRESQPLHISWLLGYDVTCPWQSGNCHRRWRAFSWIVEGVASYFRLLKSSGKRKTKRSYCIVLSSLIAFFSICRQPKMQQ